MLKKISERIGFTPTEIKVLIFLLLVFLTGYCIKTFYPLGDKSTYKNFDYSAEDSAFNSKGLNNRNFSSGNKELLDKKVDYKQEVLDFNRSKFRKNENRKIPVKLSININKAGKNELTRLPGIGDKTAEKIIIFRKKIGGFTKLNELLKVKGIGNSKFNNIKKYVYLK